MDTPAINNIVGLLGHREPTNDETKDAVREAVGLFVGVATNLGRIADALSSKPHTPSYTPVGGPPPMGAEYR